MGLLVDFARSIIDNHLWLYLNFSFFFFILQFLIVKKHLYSIFDPLVMFVFFNGFSWSTVLMVSYVNDNYFYLFDISVINLCFLIPALFFKKIDLHQLHSTILMRTKSFDFQVFYVFFFVLAFSTISLWLIRGVPLFSENPDRAKSVLYEEGFGIVRYIHFVIPLFCVFFSLFCITYLKNSIVRKIILVTILFFSILIMLSMGSKSSLLAVVLVCGLVGVTDFNNLNARFIRKVSYLIMILAIFFVFLVLFFVSGDNSILALLNLLMIRMIAFGDSFFFWYQYDLVKEMESINLIFYLLSPLLGMFRFIEQEFPLGSQLVSAVTGEDLVSFGPNGQLPIVISLVSSYFKYFLSVMFGFLFFFIRNNLYYLIQKLRVFGLVLFVGVFFDLTYIYTDILLLMSKIYSSVITFIIIYLLMLFLRACSKK
ncbi:MULTISPECIES: hypothetical protein [Shewanella]|uniref:hypothetical protein n=1 Tax=Shewanella TaxID=22 RepID=UPI0021DA079E|nr:hypothetical protein [Shewanella sp. SM87]MCU8006054.1 hypothetical protein [Shewanella sp. SM87]